MRESSSSSRTRVLGSAARPVVEHLEKRQLLSVNLEAGTLSITGTELADTIEVRPSGRFPGMLRVQVNGLVKYRRMEAVQRIEIHTLAGDDFAAVESVGRRIELPVTILGGEGHDTLAGAFGNDLIRGGAGKDLICGGGGDDQLHGGKGSDRLLGGNGNDRLRGGPGRDRISTGHVSGDADDLLLDGPAQDQVNVQYRPNFPISTFTGTPDAYSPTQIRRAYGLGELTDAGYTNRGKGQAIAIVGAFHTPTARRDLTTFSRAFRLPLPTKKTFRQIYASGKRPSTDEQWCAEALLDIEWAHAIAPEATIVLVEADSALWADVNHAIDVAVRYLDRHFGGGVVSLSIAGIENAAVAEAQDRVFDNKHTKKISFVAAAGDTPGPSYPATNPNVLAVGGTTLFLDAYGNRVGGDDITEIDDETNDPTEIVDSEPATAISIPGGERPWFDAGSGPSTVYPAPEYQETRLGLTTRGTPDIAWAADPRTPVVDNDATPPWYIGRGAVAVWNSFGEGGAAGWFAVGGTSAGAPQFAAVVALANQLRDQTVITIRDRKTGLVKKQTLGKIGNTLLDRIYRLGGLGPDLYFNDIDQLGTGLLPDDTFIYPAGAGWDYASGWGSPNCRTLIPALADQRLRATFKTIHLSGQINIYNPVPDTTLPRLTTIMFAGTGEMQGLGTLNLTAKRPRGLPAPIAVPLDLTLYGAPSNITVTATLFGLDELGIPSPGNPIIVHRCGNSLVGQGKFEVRVQPTEDDTGDGEEVVLRGYLKFSGRVNSSGEVSGEFYSAYPDGGRIRGVFTPNPFPDLAEEPVAYITSARFES